MILTLVALVLATLLLHCVTALPLSGDDKVKVEPINGGRNARPYEWPWMSLVLTSRGGGTYLCGGTLIEEDIVITAAHCLDGITGPEDIQVRLGAHYLREVDNTTQLFNAIAFAMHPDYDNNRITNDIGLIFLSGRPRFDDGTVAIVPRLSDSTYDSMAMTGKHRCFITGYGLEQGKEGNWQLPLQLKESKATVLPLKKCQRRSPIASYVDGVLCTKSSACSGDSGGPLVCKLKKKWTLLGVHSFKSIYDGCHKRPTFKGDAQVSYFRDWISSTIDNQRGISSQNE